MQKKSLGRVAFIPGCTSSFGTGMKKKSKQNRMCDFELYSHDWLLCQTQAITMLVTMFWYIAALVELGSMKERQHQSRGSCELTY